ncbi:MAG: copper chaperone PCu(A)C [Chloroflexota bacterium]
MKKLLLILVVGVLLLTACQAEEESVEAHDYWLRAAAQGENSAMYLLLHNHETTTDEFIGASSEIAEAVELHSSTVDANGVMQMSPVAAVELLPDAEVYFEPGGLHVMFIGLKQDLQNGDEVQVTLHFRNHEDIVLTVPVQEGPGEMH